MKLHDFFREYANTPIPNRYKAVELKFPISEPTTLQTIYKRILRLDEQMQPLKIEMDELLRLAEKGFNNNENESHKTNSKENA